MGRILTPVRSDPMKASVSVVTKLNIFLGLLLASMVVVVGLAVFAGVSGLAAGLLGLYVVGVTAAAVYLRLAIRKGILRSIRAAARVIGHVAEGDLTVKVDVTSHGETQKMLAGLDAMTADLRHLVSEVASGARTVADTSAQIAQGNLDLSQRTEEQASTLEETASSMEELTSTVAHSADNARQAAELAASASEVARRGGQVVGQVVSTMTDISDASRRIGDIIGVIDGIAFQTNILALNAAVEAARAGDQGRGFAAVATEVRNLAQRSAAAAREIKTLIHDSVNRVEAGTRLVDAAGKTMGEIVSSVRKVSDLIAEIAAASQEQSTGIGQVNTAVAQMEQVVQQNASLVEQATAATESMKEQAAALQQLVARFRLSNEEPGGADWSRPAGRPAGHATVPPVRRHDGHALPPAAAPVLAAARPQSTAKGQWEEF
ncbi:MAG: HAMP domain-containing protein [Ramlibacter sp.]|nr:HAMP domain-containing protein [Ramlibacter sp.]